MVTRKSQSTPPPRLPMTVAEMNKGVEILARRIADIEALDPLKASEGEIRSLECKIEESLTRVFGENGDDRWRYASAATFDHGPVSIAFGDRGGRRDRRGYIIEGRIESLATLKGAVETLKERIADAEPIPEAKSVGSAFDPATSDKVFIVHGHDGELKQEVARIITSLGLQPIILHEQPNGGGTVIEKFERESDVGYAVILFTPDDFGGSQDDSNVLQRARQNVVLELGYFIGKLGRKRVCVIVKDNIEKPSDIHGVVWLDYGSHWKVDLAKELKHAGYGIDFNKLF